MQAYKERVALRADIIREENVLYAPYIITKSNWGDVYASFGKVPCRESKLNQIIDSLIEKRVAAYQHLMNADDDLPELVLSEQQQREQLQVWLFQQNPATAHQFKEKVVTELQARGSGYISIYDDVSLLLYLPSDSLHQLHTQYVRTPAVCAFWMAVTPCSTGCQPCRPFAPFLVILWSCLPPEQKEALCNSLTDTRFDFLFYDFLHSYPRRYDNITTRMRYADLGHPPRVSKMMCLDWDFTSLWPGTSQISHLHKKRRLDEYAPTKDW